MDFKKINFPPLQFEAQRLKAAAAIGFADRYKQFFQSYLNQFCEIDTEVLTRIREILLNETSYEIATVNIEQSVEPLLANVSKTGNLPHHQINSIADLVDEGKTNLYPLNQLTVAKRDELCQLCEVASLINAVTNKHSNTDLFELYSAWGVSPPKDKAKNQS